MSVDAAQKAIPVPTQPVPQPVEQLAAQHNHFEGLYAGLDKVDEQLSPENRDQLTALTGLDTDPQEAKARMVNMAYLKANNPQLDEDALNDNWETAKVQYAHQALGLDKAEISDKELYAGISGKMAKAKDERVLMGEGLGKLFDAFRAGGDNMKQAFTSTLAEMKGKPGYDPARLDVYRHLAESQWQHWEDAGQHYPAAVQAISQYFQAYHGNTGTEEQQLEARQAAIHALNSVPTDQQDAILGLAMRKPGKAEDAGGMEKAAGRLEAGIGQFGSDAARSLSDLVTGQQAGLGGILASQAGRQGERKLDAAVQGGGLDPYKGSNWLSEAALGAAEGLPRMLAMFHPAGIVANVGAFAEESRGHFEDAGIDPAKANGLGLAAAIPLTALQMVTSKTVVGEGATAGMEAWMLRNITGQTGAALAKGYAKNMLAAGAESTALLYGMTVGQQLTEPAIQSLGHLLDGTIPGVKWTGADGELMKVANATPNTLASLVPLIALGAGMANLRTRGQALDLATIQNKAALEALGFNEAHITNIMAAKTPEDAANIMQAAWNERVVNQQAVQELNKQMDSMANEGGRVGLAEDSGYTVKDGDGNPIGQTGSAEMAAKVASEDSGKKPVSLDDSSHAVGIVAGGGQIGALLNAHLASMKALVREIGELPQFKGFKEVLNKWTGDTQLGIMRTAEDVGNVVRSLPDALTRRAVGRWLDAGGDRTKLEGWRDSSSKLESKKEYETALNLTPDQLKLAEGIQQWFKGRFEKAVQSGVMDEAQFRSNYLTQLIERPFVQGGENSKFGQQLNKNFKFSKQRVFPNLFDLEQAGFSAKTTDVAEIMARYDSALNKAILTRQLVKDLLATKNEQGEALAVPLKGTLREGEGAEPNFISNPRQTVVDPLEKQIEGLKQEAQGLKDTISNSTDLKERLAASDRLREIRDEVKDLESQQSPEDAKLYKSIDHPALRKWWWMGKDQATGKDTFMEGDIGLHPDIKTHLENALGTSGLRRWYDSEGNMMSSVPKRVVKALDMSNGFLKRNLLGGLSLFHAVHEYKRALGNRVAVNPFDLPEIKPDDPRVQLQVRTGLMLATPHDVTNLYSHQTGLGESGSLVDHVPGIGKLSKAVSEYTFQKLIPGLKSAVWNHVYERNLETFKDAIAKGDATKEQVAYVTSNQINARFGHQNLADLGRNPTVQHLLQIGTLAPDFWESNLRNYGQDMKGLVGAKIGREPAIALATTAAVLWTTSRLLNKALDDDWHFEEPFGVIADGRTYTMRNEVEDLVRMWKNNRGYIMGRLSPSTQAVEEWLSNRNWRGEKIDSTEVFKNWVSKVFPMSLRFLPGIKQATDALETGGGRTVNVWQQFLGSIGVQVARHSPLNAAYQLANDWNKKNGDKEDRGTYPVSKFQQLRYALEDEDEPRAVEQIAKLKKESEPLYKLTQAFKSAVFHPWTGTAAKDAEFKDSLNPEDKATVDKAEAHRQAVFDRYLAIIDKTNP